MKGRMIISDHALVRYLDRVGGFEIEQLREQIADRLRPFAETGCGAVIIDGHAYVIETCPRKGPVLVTVIPHAGGHRPLAERRGDS